MTNPELQFKEYLGDGVYAAWDEDLYAVVLTTENGIDVTTTIVLEPEVLDTLKKWITLALIRRTKARREATS